jgi:hypothetical protein
MHFIPLSIQPGHQGKADRFARCKKPKNPKKRYSLFVIRYWLKDQSRIKANRASGPRGALREAKDIDHNPQMRPTASGQLYLPEDTG